MSAPGQVGRGRTDAELGQVADQRGVELDLAALHQLQDGHTGEELGERTGPVEGGRGGGRSSGDIGQPVGLLPDHALAIDQVHHEGRGALPEGPSRLVVDAPSR